MSNWQREYESLARQYREKVRECEFLREALEFWLSDEFREPGVIENKAESHRRLLSDWASETKREENKAKAVKLRGLADSARERGDKDLSEALHQQAREIEAES